MALKRFAPPPPVESSEEAASGSDTYESEEEIAHSPPVAAPKNTAPPLQRVQQPEATDDEEEEEERNSEEEEGEEEEEVDGTDDEVPQPVAAPRPEAKRKGGKQALPPSSRDKKAKQRDFGELCQMYPYLAEEVKALERTHPGMFKREFSMIDDDEARQLDQKIKKLRVSEVKLELRHLDMTKEVTKALMNLLE